MYLNRIVKKNDFSLLSFSGHILSANAIQVLDTEMPQVKFKNFKNYINQLLQLCTARTAWSKSDQAVRTVHSCNSW